jgi:uncharacterized protein (DUF1330 family)
MLYLVIKLYVRPGKLDAFHVYEKKVLALFRRHGGEVVAAFAPEPGPEGEDGPDEIHVLSIATRTQLNDFQADPERNAMAEEREAVLRASDTLVSRHLFRY